jgi:hypothetical protein
VDGGIAVVDARTSQIDRLCYALRAALRPSGVARAVPAGTEEEYVARVLSAFDREEATIALAVWLDGEVVVGTCQRGYVYLYQEDTLVDLVAVSQRVAGNTSVRVTRFAASAGGCLALVNRSVADRISQSDVRRALCAEPARRFSGQTVAERLAALASEPGDRNASAVVVRFGAAEKRAATPEEPAAALPWRPTDVHSQTGVTASLLAVAALVSTFLLLGQFLGTPPPIQTASSGNVAAHMPRRPNVRALPITHATARVPLRAPGSAAPAQTVVSHALQSWEFPALPGVRGDVLLALYNPQKASVVTEVRIIAKTGVDRRRVRVPARSTVKLPLQSATVHDARQGIVDFVVQTTAPILPMRAVVGQASSPAAL